MKGKKFSSYAAALVITLIGAGATMLLVNAAYLAEEDPLYADLDPTNLNTDFGR